MSDNISLNGKDVFLFPKKYYYVIDALYLNNIKTDFHTLVKNRIEQEIKEKIFPYTDAPFAKVLISNSTFRIDNIKKAKYEELSSEKKNYFVSDTGLILLIEESYLALLLENYNYDDLVDSPTEDINMIYWRKITSKIPEGDIGLILAPGVDSGYEFEGGGVYKII